MIEEICLGAGIVLALVLIAYLLFFSQPFTYRKKIYKDKTSLTIEAKKNLSRVTVLANDITFERKRVRQGQIIEFDYPSSSSPAKVEVELEGGRVKTFEV